MIWCRSIAARAYASIGMAGLAATFTSVQSVAGPLADSVKIELRGEIRPSCALAGAPASLDLGEISQGAASGQTEFTFQLSCNTPFTYRLSSVNGAMRNDEGAAGTGFAAEFPYKATLTILADDGGALTLDCAGAALSEASGGCLAGSGDRTAMGQDASLAVSWGPLESRLDERPVYGRPAHRVQRRELIFGCRGTGSLWDEGWRGR